MPMRPPSPPISRRVLVVDDNPDSAECLTLYLSIVGHEVRAAFSGAEALAVAREFRPEAVLLDIGMPDMDGREVGRLLRNEHPSLLIIAVTGYAGAEESRQSRLAGFDHHLVKPIDPGAIGELLTRLASPPDATP